MTLVIEHTQQWILTQEIGKWIIKVLSTRIEKTKDLVLPLYQEERGHNENT
jgi:hypothetical protein